jgi:hypothetical protein
MPIRKELETKESSNSKITIDTQDFINEVETLHLVDNLPYNQISKLYGVSDKWLREIRKGRAKPSKKLLDRGHKVFIQELPINYVAYIRTVVSETGNYFIVDVERRRSIQGSTQRLYELRELEYQDTFIDGTISDYKPDIVNKLAQWVNKFDKDIQNRSTVKMWIYRANF